MRDFSKVSPSLWRSRKFRAVQGSDARVVYLYLLTCPHGNSAGCFDIHPGYACADLDMLLEPYQDALEAVEKAGLAEVDWSDNTVLITNWLEFNAPSNPKHALGILSQLDQASAIGLKIKRFQELEAQIRARRFDREAAVRAALASFTEAYRDAIPTETRDQRPETRDQTETRPDQTETAPGQRISASAMRILARLPS